MIDLDSDLVSGLPAEEVLLRARHARLIFGKATRALFFWLKEVENRRLFSKWGYSSLFAFAESELELDPRTISEMLRTHRCLKELPGLQALAEEIAPSKLREISRVCTPLTESFWIEQARAKSCRVIEKLVSITPKGGLPPVALGEERRDKEPSIAGNVPEPTS
ncbi:MAG: hypothetical protein HYU64_16020, partial [Armatimonadetes bacterium]|nr:hypothetical protein [Armatimonadota bacterium]